VFCISAVIQRTKGYCHYLKSYSSNILLLGDMETHNFWCNGILMIKLEFSMSPEQFSMFFSFRSNFLKLFFRWSMSVQTRVKKCGSWCHIVHSFARFLLNISYECLCQKYVAGLIFRSIDEIPHFQNTSVLSPVILLSVNFFSLSLSKLLPI
jgi:hypothetical protein